MWCNCDANSDNWLEDSGDITEKENLPVKQLRFGDTGTPLDDKEGRYTLGPLICEGDGNYDNIKNKIFEFIFHKRHSFFSLNNIKFIYQKVDCF